MLEMNLNRRYPYVNENVACKWPLNIQVADEMRSLAAQRNIFIYQIVQHCLGRFCIQSPGNTWLLANDVNITNCRHVGTR